MNPIAHRLSLVRQRLGLTSRAQMAAKLGLPTSTYSAYEGPDGPPKLEWLLAMHNWGVNINWLLTGHGQMLRQEDGAAAAMPAPAAIELDEVLLAAMIKAVERKERESGRQLEPLEKGSMVARLYVLAHGCTERELASQMEGHFTGE